MRISAVLNCSTMRQLAGPFTTEVQTLIHLAVWLTKEPAGGAGGARAAIIAVAAVAVGAAVGWQHCRRPGCGTGGIRRNVGRYGVCGRQIGHLFGRACVARKCGGRHRSVARIRSCKPGTYSESLLPSPCGGKSKASDKAVHWIVHFSRPAGYP